MISVNKLPDLYNSQGPQGIGQDQANTHIIFIMFNCKTATLLQCNNVIPPTTLAKIKNAQVLSSKKT